MATFVQEAGAERRLDKIPKTLKVIEMRKQTDVSREGRKEKDEKTRAGERRRGVVFHPY